MDREPVDPDAGGRLTGPDLLNRQVGATLPAKDALIGLPDAPASEAPWTATVRSYDLRTNQHFTLKMNQLGDENLKDFIRCYSPANRHGRIESERFRPFSYDELVARDKASLDITWLRDDSLEDTKNLPPPEVIAQEIVDDLEAALAEFGAVAASLRKSG